MSRQVTVSYKGLSIQIQAQCDTAIHSLCKIDKALDNIHRNANTLETSKVKEYEKYLLNAKEKIKNKIEDFKKVLEEYQSLRKSGDEYVLVEYENVKRNLENKSRELTKIVNELTGSKLEVINQMINEGLLNVGSEVTQGLMDKMNGAISISNNDLSKLNTIDDVSLRELVYRQFINNKSISFDKALNNAKDEYDILLGKRTNEVIQECKEELKTNGVSIELLNNVKSIDEANKITNEAIVSEKIRKETLKIIIKSIKERGFIVDTKNNLKIDKDKNIVKLVALKASGQTAEFEIQLNGKFMYHFDGYEGSACKKDITPFLDDLKNIYDINILHEDVQWSNPDKIQTQKYQYIKHNKGTN